MTWEQFLQKYSKYDHYKTALMINVNVVNEKQIVFYDNGDITFDGAIYAKNRTPDQMDMIIQNLIGE